MSKSSFVVASLVGIIAVVAVSPASARPGGSPAIQIVRVASATGEGRPVLHLRVEAQCDNPFDADDVAVDAEVRARDGKSFATPGFLYQPFTRRLVDGAEVLEAAGPQEWQVRLALPRAGVYEAVVRVRDRNGTTRSKPVRLQARRGGMEGFVQVDPRDRRWFRTRAGAPVYPIGANLCWAGKAGTFDYDAWLAAYAANGCNWFRLFLSPYWTTLTVNTRAAGYDRVDLAAAWRLDHVLGLAERLGIRAQFCFEATTDLHDTADYASFATSVYNAANGGPLLSPGEFYTNVAAQRAFRNKLRYHVARWGAGPSVFAWELMNEADLTRDYETLRPRIYAWHSEMARALRALDQGRHMVTTSLMQHHVEDPLNSHPDLDFAQTHHYQMEDEVAAFEADVARMPSAGKRPYFHGEFGVTQGTEAQRDPRGVSVHNALWSAPGLLQAGTPMSWWWDNYIAPCRLYGEYGRFAAWVRGFDFGAQALRRANVDVSLAGPASSPPPDLLLEPSLESWSPGPASGPVTLRLEPTGALSPAGRLPGILHGVGNHPELHNPVTFVLDSPRAGSLSVRVTGVSWAGGARLALWIDGRRAVDTDMPVPPGHAAGRIIEAYNGDYSAPIPPGRHRVRIENRGKDWIRCSYSVSGYLTRSAAPVRTLGVTGRTEGLLWVQNRAYTWPAANRPGPPPAPVRGVRIVVRGLAPGAYRVERFATTEGGPRGVWLLRVGKDGALRLPVTDVAWDAAYRWRRVAPRHI
jgi:hypothetical protein